MNKIEVRLEKNKSMELNGNKLRPEVLPLLKRRGMVGKGALLASIFFAFGGIFVTHETNEFGWAVFTFFGTLALGVFGVYNLSRSVVPVRKPAPIFAWLLMLSSLAIGGLILYYSWERFFSQRDDDAGLAIAVIALEAILASVFQFCVLSNHKKGVYREMLEPNENLK